MPLLATPPITWAYKPSPSESLWHCSIRDALVLEVAGNSCRELRQSLHEPPQFPSQFLAILRQAVRSDVRFHVPIQVLIRIPFRRVLREGEDLDPIRLVRQPLVHH